jgi:lipoprotein-anchoring transpeptidase ErfK/SrfK
MVDYYSILLRAVTTSGGGDAQWRRGVFGRARQMLANQLRTRQPPLSDAEIDVEVEAMDRAIERIESEMAWTDSGGTVSPPPRRPPPKSSRQGALLRPGGVPLVAALVLIAGFIAGAFVLWPRTPHPSAPPAIKTEAPKSAPKTAPGVPAAPAIRAATRDGDLAPGTDGGSSDAELPYVFRRQPTFYRTLQPPGTIIVDKLQHFLYFIQPNSVALRYGIGIGEECKDLAGLRHIASKAEWPPWRAPPDMIRRYPAEVPGGPGNPLGARLLQLDDGASHINGTNAPGTIGSSVVLGCIRLVNDDIIDLYNRASVNATVVVN